MHRYTTPRKTGQHQHQHQHRHLHSKFGLASILALSGCCLLYVLDASSSISNWLYTDPEEEYIRQARRNAMTTEFNGEPSHIRMCRHLMPRFDHALAVETVEKKARQLGLTGLNLANIPELQIPEEVENEYLVVEEDEHVCASKTQPTDSLLQIFSSTLLSVAARRFKLDVEYRHNCAQWRKDRMEAAEARAQASLNEGENHDSKNDLDDLQNIPLTIQEKLPFDLLDNDKTDDVPLEVLAIKNICVGCITEYEANNGTISPRNCVLFTRPTIYTPLSQTSKKSRRRRVKRGKYKKRTKKVKADLDATLAQMADERVEKGAIADAVDEEIIEASIQSGSSRRLAAAGSPSSSGSTDEQNKPQLPVGIVSIMPVMKENLREVAHEWTEKELEDDPEDRLKTRPGALEKPSLKETPGLKNPANLGEPGAYSKLTDDHTVIYLHCKKENCDVEAFGDSIVMPYYVYATEIPNHVSTITVMVSSECVEHVEGCDSHVQALVGFLKQYYPRALVTYLEESSTYAAFSRMVSADYIVCPPGLACMIPSLTTAGKSTQVANPNLVFWLSQLSAENIWNMKFLPMNDVPVTSVTLLDFNNFLNKIPPGKIGQCRQLRGRLGSWVQDMALAPSMQYTTPLRHYVGEADMKFSPTDELPFRTPTTYRWEEEIFPTCGVQTLTLEGLCFAMAEIDIDRIFIIGDSSSMNQAQSLWKLLGNEDNPNEFGTRDPNWDREVYCEEEDRTITISYARNDQLIENDQPVDIEKDQRNCYAYCYPWVDRYLDFEGTTLLLANTGAHYQTHHQFQYTLREFLRTIDSLHRSWDIMIYRTSLPGHRDCDEKFDTPYSSYDEYAHDVTDEYSWDKFVGYNDYATKLISDRNKEDSRKSAAVPPNTAAEQSQQVVEEPSRMKVEILDVYPMTVLRRDGHVSGEECEDCQSLSVRDCMHYFLPGPLDWWNHLLLSHMLDLGRRE